MWRLVLLMLALCFVNRADAQLPRGSFLGPTCPGPGSLCKPVSAPSGNYVGPLDIVGGATGCLALRACSLAYALSHGAIADLRGNSSGTFTINALSNGNFDSATATTDCTTGGNTFCFVTKLYDQSGNGNHVTQTVGGEQPGLNLSCLGAGSSLPCINFSGAAGYLTAPSAVPAASYPVSMSAVAERTSVDASHFDAILSMQTTGTPGPNLEWNETANSSCLNTGGTATSCPNSGAVSDNAFHIFNGVANGNSTVHNIDGTDGTATGTNGGASTGMGVGAAPTVTPSALMTGNASEWIWFNGTAFSPTQRAAMCHNQYTYWQTSVPC